MKLLFATTNKNKLTEMCELLAPAGVEILGLDALPARIPAPDENGTTFEENAKIKATTYAMSSGLTCLADDSGLEVDALGGAPGVRSARYAGEGETRQQRDLENRRKLISELSALGDVPRTARLVCCLCLSDSLGNVLFNARGEAEGEIVNESQGSHGFGYDVHLLLPDVQKTAAELAPHEWNARSHRGQAVAALLKWIASTSARSE